MTLRNGGLFLLYFVLGYLFFASVFVGIGSLFSNEEDAHHLNQFMRMLSILPILLALAFFLQQQMTPMMTADPTQAKIMKFMPVMFGVFFLWFPTGLVLYSLVNALTGVIQQFIFNLLANRKTK
ncbi:MAG: YidC/Oxa1 family membrane protein insertase, partial [Planctomycetes bacterium]|nr:YidC/Oxa1 family membrane protein insertase [Planctomycetota bacterium]